MSLEIISVRQSVRALVVPSVVLLAGIATGCAEPGQSDASTYAYVSDPLMSSKDVDAAQILSENLSGELSFTGADRGDNGRLSKMDPQEIISCSSAKKGKYGSALFHSPRALRRYSRDAQGVASRSGYFSSLDAARAKLSEKLKGTWASGVVCLQGRSYNTFVRLDRTSMWDYGRNLEFTGIRSGADGYKSAVTLKINFETRSVEEKVGRKVGKVEYTFVSSMTLSSQNGDQETWSFVPPEADLDKMKTNLKRYLETWNDPAKLRALSAKQSEPYAGYGESLASCSYYRTSRIDLEIDALMRTVFPGVKVTTEQANARGGRDERNYLAVEVWNTDKNLVVYSRNLDVFSIPPSSGSRKFKTEIRLEDASRYELRISPVLDGVKAHRAATRPFLIRYEINDSGACGASLDLTSDDNGVGFLIELNLKN